jgi:hypothetical protein
MINAAYHTKLIAEELAETIRFGDLHPTYDDLITREKDTEGKKQYILKMRGGTVRVVSPRKIFVNPDLCKSVREAKYVLQMDYIGSIL